MTRVGHIFQKGTAIFSKLKTFVQRGLQGKASEQLRCVKGEDKVIPLQARCGPEGG